ncbi:MAG: hypothetical protein RL181_1618 [Bacteroidota bacterium]|jgi:hemolysin III
MRFNHYYDSVALDIVGPSEEWANVLTHGLGLLLVLAGIPALWQGALAGGSTLHAISAVAFGFGLFLVYLFSTLYHLANRPMVRRWMRILDHIAIYFLIAGSYTPFILLFVNTRSGYTVLTVIWSLTAFGLVYKIFATHKFRLLSTLVYLGMGWAVVFIIGPMVQRVPWEVLRLILAGGAFYTLGAFVYLFRKMPYYHAVWHLFVMGGSLCHYLAVIRALQFV